MATTTTPRLGLVKPTPGTGELVNVATQINTAWDKIDENIGAREVANAAARSALANPFRNQFVRQTDDNSLWICTDPAGTWSQVVLGGTTATMKDYIRVSRSSAVGGAFVARADGDSADRMIIDASGKIAIGSGSGAQDTVVYRSAANTLATDGNFSVGGNLSVTGIGREIWIKKANDTARTTSTKSLDPDLQVSLPANTSWTYEMVLWVLGGGAAAGKINLGYQFPSGARNTVAGVGLHNGTAGTNTSGGTMENIGYWRETTSPGAATSPYFAGTVMTPITVRGFLEIFGTAGTFGLFWGQMASNASATTILRDSWLELKRRS